MKGVLLGMVASLTLGFGVQTWRINELKADVAEAKQLAKDEGKRADKSESLRATEQSQDRASYSAATVRCDDRVQAARKVGAVIEEITNVQAHTGGSVGRPIVNADQLRIIIGQGGAAQAASVSVGTDGSAAQ